MAFCSWVFRLDPCKHCGSPNVELKYLGSKNRLDGSPDSPPITVCKSCGKWSDMPYEDNFENTTDKIVQFIDSARHISEKIFKFERPEKQGVIHMAKCCANCMYYADATVTTGQCEKHSKIIVQNKQVCDYFKEI